MTIADLQFVIENPSGSYKHFADTLAEYPILGVTYPTHYGYIVGYRSEDGHELDVFIGNGPLFGALVVDRTKDGVPYTETKTIFGVNQAEWDAIRTIFEPVTVKMIEWHNSDQFLNELTKFKEQ